MSALPYLIMWLTALISSVLADYMLGTVNVHQTFRVQVQAPNFLNMPDNSPFSVQTGTISGWYIDNIRNDVNSYDVEPNDIYPTAS